ncbi:unnamed protein product [Vitrella brassicaformis CCMP3155]|uniref:Uncharacterized protein n=1 Tax=Vitrella brassicaformis (strain CCMP3155) TaxID=1169540 RepID=A0A0G4EWC4_VITBC|nr:unnamed protein product [Vitrella brassicaformis CCMP3155]|mmetsp:Transcript_46082/g.114580  ORF Transcript_46082/g.114580 Transcript_46082/m.114580 type:complete len:301 (-) Transcript_46082:141-1043(-)|eukprot:CEM02553.1 unnamed protein product [Vitrella brassicaformis CCMP3155]
MSENLIDGKKTAQDIRNEVKAEVEKMVAEHNQHPKLSVILVGGRRDSSTYVGMKERACKECGIESEVIRMPDTVSQAEVMDKVRELNADPNVDGILVQLPLPSHMVEREVLELIDWFKDVDGLHPLNVGNLALRDHTPMFKPCTAEGCIELLRRYNVKMSGADAVVVGRSNIVGMPISLLLQQENATVTMCHSRTKDLPGQCRKADIIVAAIGKANFIKGDWVKDGAVIIDVGINGVDDPTSAKGYRLVGDVDFEECKGKAKLITPVPGGVGPMTVALLMKNTASSRLYKLSAPQTNGTK